MRKRLFPLTSCLVLAFALLPSALATTTSFTGSLSTSDSTFETTFTLAASGNVTLQTFSFGGGVKGNSQVIPDGGFDPLLAIFSGTGPSAAVVTDGTNTFATSDILTNYASFVGCPPAGLLTIGADASCGDIQMTLSLGPGTYTVVLSDAAYIPFAFFDNGTLGEGFVDLTGGGFQTCDTSGTCVDRTSDYAFDLTTPAVTSTPEPSSLLLLGAGLICLIRSKRK